MEEQEPMEITFEIIDKKTGIRIFENTWNGIDLDFSIRVSHNVNQKKSMHYESVKKHKRTMKNFRSLFLTVLMIIFTLCCLYFTYRTLFDHSPSNFDTIAKWLFFILTVIVTVLKLISYHTIDDAKG